MNKSSPPIPIIILIIMLIILIIALFTINYYVPIFPHNYRDTSPQQLEDEREKESFRGRRHRRHHRRPYRRNWYGDYWGYRYRPPPPPPIYTYSWFNPWFWNSPICKRGCTQTSIGEWGCQYPGYSPNDCLFASDCRGC